MNMRYLLAGLGLALLLRLAPAVAQDTEETEPPAEPETPAAAEAAPAAPPESQPAPRTGVFIPTEKIPADAAISFPVDI
jgi:hypothetical protein